MRYDGGHGKVNQWICRGCGAELTALNIVVPGVCRKCNASWSWRGIKLQRVHASIATGLPLVGERLTVASFLEAWLRDNATHKVRVKTFVRYRELVWFHITPVMGRISKTKLTPQHVERMMTSVATKGAFHRTVQHCRAVLRNVLHYAMRHSLVGRNVVALADGPPVRAREVTPLTLDAARRVLRAVRGDRLKVLFTVALACGLRQSETLGLRWSDVIRGCRHSEFSVHSTAGQRGVHLLHTKDDAVPPDHSHACPCSDSPMSTHEAPARERDVHGSRMGWRCLRSASIH